MSIISLSQGLLRSDEIKNVPAPCDLLSRVSLDFTLCWITQQCNLLKFSTPMEDTIVLQSFPLLVSGPSSTGYANHSFIHLLISQNLLSSTMGQPPWPGRACCLTGRHNRGRKAQGPHQ